MDQRAPVKLTSPPYGRGQRRGQSKKPMPFAVRMGNRGRIQGK
jgi:hypothetical protein